MPEPVKDDVTLAHIFTAVGRVQATMESHTEELKFLRADVRAIRTAQQVQSVTVANLGQECARRQKHCSDEFHRLGGRMVEVENTGVHSLVDLKARWSTIRWIAVIVVGIVALASASIGVYRACIIDSNKAIAAPSSSK